VARLAVPGAHEVDSAPETGEMFQEIPTNQEGPYAPSLLGSEQYLSFGDDKLLFGDTEDIFFPADNYFGF